MNENYGIDWKPKKTILKDIFKFFINSTVLLLGSLVFFLPFMNIFLIIFFGFSYPMMDFTNPLLNEMNLYRFFFILAFGWLPILIIFMLLVKYSSKYFYKSLFESFDNDIGWPKFNLKFFSRLIMPLFCSGIFYWFDTFLIQEIMKEIKYLN